MQEHPSVEGKREQVSRHDSEQLSEQSERVFEGLVFGDLCELIGEEEAAEEEEDVGSEQRGLDQKRERTLQHKIQSRDINRSDYAVEEAISHHDPHYCQRTHSV